MTEIGVDMELKIGCSWITIYEELELQTPMNLLW